MAGLSYGAKLQTWEVKDAWLDLQCELAEGPYYESETHSFRFVDIVGKKVFFLDLYKGPDSLRFVKVEDAVGVTADIAGVTDRLLVAAKYGFAVMDRATGALTYLARPWPTTPLPGTDPLTVTASKAGRMRFNDGGVDPSGRFFGGSMTDNTLGLPVLNEGALFRLDPPVAKGTPQCFQLDDAIAAVPLPVTVALDPVHIPNGLAWTNSGRTLLFNDSPSRTLWAFDYDAESATLSNRRPFYTVPIPDHGGEEVPDGCCVDANGDVWIAIWGGYRVIRVDGRTAQVTGVVKVPARCVSCPRFVRGGGLVITTAREEEPDKRRADLWGGRLYWVDVGVEGGKVWKWGGKGSDSEQAGLQT